jgi:hypothetical protein
MNKRHTSREKPYIRAELDCPSSPAERVSAASPSINFRSRPLSFFLHWANAWLCAALFIFFRANTWILYPAGAGRNIQWSGLGCSVEREVRLGRMEDFQWSGYYTHV